MYWLLYSVWSSYIPQTGSWKLMKSMTNVSAKMIWSFPPPRDHSVHKCVRRPRSSRLGAHITTLCKVPPPPPLSLYLFTFGRTEWGGGGAFTLTKEDQRILNADLYASYRWVRCRNSVTALRLMSPWPDVRLLRMNDPANLNSNSDGKEERVGSKNIEWTEWNSEFG